MLPMTAGQTTLTYTFLGIEDPNTNPNATDKDGRNALHIAAFWGRVEVIKSLLEHKELLEAKDINGRTPLMEAANYGNQEACEILLKAEANPYAMNKKGQNALHLAALEGKIEVVKLLVVHKLLLKTKDTDGNTPMMLTTLYGYRAAFEILLYAGANPRDTNQSGQNTFHLAAKVGTIDILQLLLLALDKQLLETKDIYGLTPLMLTAFYGHEEACKILLQAGAKPNITCKYGRNALHFAAAKGKIKIVQQLIPLQKQLDTKDERGNTPLMIAALFGHPEASEILLQAGAKANSSNKEGRNALHYAAAKGNIKVVQLLVTLHKQLLDTKDAVGWTSLILATHYRHFEACKILLQADDNPNANYKKSRKFRINDGKAEIEQVKTSSKISISFASEPMNGRFKYQSTIVFKI